MFSVHYSAALHYAEESHKWMTSVEKFPSRVG